jgi:hypothetical protein
LEAVTRILDQTAKSLENTEDFEAARNLAETARNRFRILFREDSDQYAAADIMLKVVEAKWLEAWSNPKR